MRQCIPWLAAAQRLIAGGLLFVALPAAAQTTVTLDGYLRQGQIQEGMAAFAQPANDGERFSLAVLEALNGLQQFSAGFCKLGLSPNFAESGIAFFRIVSPDAQKPTQEKATPEKVANLFRNLRSSLELANTTLAGIGSGEFKVEVNLSQVHLDLNGDGVVAPDELLTTSLGRVLGIPNRTQNGADVVIHFDSADAAWLQGYTHFLTGLLDVLTAYDWKPVWDQCAQVIFQHPDPEPPIEQFSGKPPEADEMKIADLIAGLHAMQLELVDHDGLRNARDEFLKMTACSRLCWQRVLAETDDDHEWLPSPRQTGMGGEKITQPQIDGWMHILDELDAILTGKKLLPHWRIKDGYGINIDKLVAAPPRLDLVLMIQGSAFVPYVEAGELSDVGTWNRLTQPYGPGFWRFALWSQ
jgi:hypothetical protein